MQPERTAVFCHGTEEMKTHRTIYYTCLNVFHKAFLIGFLEKSNGKMVFIKIEKAKKCDFSHRTS